MDAAHRDRCRFAALLGAAVMVGCGSKPDAGRARPPESSPPGANVTAPSESLRVELVVPQRVRAGESVRVTLRVRNGSSRTIDLYLRGREPTMDVTVERAGGEVVWRRLEGAVIPASLLLRPLPAGETLDLSASWDQRLRNGTPVPAGDYRVRAALLLESAQLASEAVPLSIPDR